jgi:DNA modification methylase
MTKKKTADKRRQEIITEKRKAARTQTRPEIEMLAVDRLVPYAKNAKKHDDRQVAAIAGSIREFGFTNPVLIDGQDGIIAGHGRVLAARLAGLAEIPCIRLAHLTDAQRRAYILADNRLAETGGGWDADMLAAEVESIDWEELESFGLDDMDLGEILAEAERGSEGDADAEPQVDRAEELNQTWGVKAGDLWLIGNHRLLCGDSTKAEDVAKAMGGEKSDLCFTSPPYNAGKYTLTGNVVKKDKTSRYGAGTSDDKPESEYVAMLVAFTRVAMDNCRVVAVNIQQLANNKFAVLKWVHEFHEHFVDRAVWYKGHGNPAMAANVMASRFEDIWIFASQDRPTRAIPTADFRGTVENVVESTGASAENVAAESHAATMPMAVCDYAIKSWTVSGAAIYDPFLGTGTTMVAAQNLGRKCYGLEISPAYCAVILQRMADAFPGIEIRKADA